MTKTASRKSFGVALAELGNKYGNIVCFDADLSKSTMSGLFAEKFPDRFFEMGIQEANMIGAAAGMSFTGKIPFICSFAAFLTGRFDQIRMSIGYANANVKLIGTHAGVGIGEDGHSQMGLEDITLMRSIPNMVVLQPSGDKETKEMIEWAIKHEGPVYIRCTRQGLTEYDLAFKLSEPQLLKKGSKTAFLASGGTLQPALEGAHLISKKGSNNPAVYNFSTIKPLNDSVMMQLAKEYEQFVVFEDHSIMGGMGSAVAEWISEFAKTPRRVIRYGVRDVFGESGTPDDLYQRHEFTAEKISKYLNI